MAPLLARRDESLLSIFVPLIIVVGAAWFVTVPFHEILHALGCLAAGGEVEELQIKRIYGGELLARVFDFVNPGGRYAGRLAAFDTHGNDFTYFSTVFAPYLLTIFFGVPLLVAAARKGSILLYGIGFVQTLLPLVSLTGDYYEMGSIVVTRLRGFRPGSHEAELLRGDDLALVWNRVSANGLDGGPALVAAGFVVGALLAWFTWTASVQAARLPCIKQLAKRGTGVYI
jgi:hypothetical protein